MLHVSIRTPHFSALPHFRRHHVSTDAFDASLKLQMLLTPLSYKVGPSGVRMTTIATLLLLISPLRCCTTPH